jgi:hypothetical protein
MLFNSIVVVAALAGAVAAQTNYTFIDPNVVDDQTKGMLFIPLSPSARQCTLPCTDRFHPQLPGALANPTVA